MKADDTPELELYKEQVIRLIAQNKWQDILKLSFEVYQATRSDRPEDN